MVENGKTLILGLVDEVLNRRRIDRLERYFSPDVVQRDLPPRQPEGLEGVREAITRAFRAFPVLRVEVVDLLEDGDTVSYRTLIRAVTPAGRRVQLRGYAVDRLSSGRIVEHWESVTLDP